MSARALTVLALAASASVPAAAQQRLLDLRRLSSGVVFESYSFSNTTPGGGAAMVSGATQFTVPVTAVIPLREGWAVDAYAAYASGTVTVDRGLGKGPEDLTLAGINDVKVRLVGKLSGDNLLLTVGGTVPNGATALSAPELEALSVLAAPALRFRTPALGTGAGATAGLVWAGQAGPWAVALGASGEYRGSYAPGEALAAGVAKPSLRSGNAAHLSFGADRLAGSTRESFSLALDYFTSGELNDPQAQQAKTDFQLGPSLTGTYQLQFTTGSIESVMYVLERYRTGYKVMGVSVSDSWRSESELGVLSAWPLSRTTSFRLSVDGRFHTANRSAFDDQTLASFATTGILAGGATVGLQHSLAEGRYGVEPFLRAQAGRLDLGGPTRAMTGFAAGLTLSTRF